MEKNSSILLKFYHCISQIQAVKLESPLEEMNRYMAVVSTTGRQDTDESVILGIDIEDDKATIGLVLPIWGSSLITLDGDGCVTFLFPCVKPVLIILMYLYGTLDFPGHSRDVILSSYAYTN